MQRAAPMGRRRPRLEEAPPLASVAAAAACAEEGAAAVDRRPRRLRLRRSSSSSRHMPATAAAAVALLALVGCCCCTAAWAFLQPPAPLPAPPLRGAGAGAAAAAARGLSLSLSAPSSSSLCKIQRPPSCGAHRGQRRPRLHPLLSALADRQSTASSGSDNEGKGGKPPATASPPPPATVAAASAIVDALSSSSSSPPPPSPPPPPPPPEGEAVAEYVAECEMPTDRGTFRMRSYRCRGRFAALEPVALTHGALRGKEGVLARIHDQCLTSEVFGSKRCDCKEQLGMALDRIREEGGVVIYLQQEGRGIGLANKVAAYALQDEGLDTVDANRHLGFGDDERTYDIVPSILQDLGVRSIRLLTNNPLKLQCLQGLGVAVTRVEPIVVAPNAHNARYLLTKQERMAHALLNLEDGVPAATAPLLARKGKGEKGGVAAARQPSSQRPPSTATTEAAAAAAAASSTGGGKREWDYSPERVQEALGALRAGRPVVLVDGRQHGSHSHAPDDASSSSTSSSSTSSSHGDLVMPAGQATPSALSTYIRATSGIVYALLSPQRLAELWKGSGAAATAGGVDARVGGGSSAAGRAATLRALGGAGPLNLKDFRSPGHVFAIAPGAAIGTAPAAENGEGEEGSGASGGGGGGGGGSSGLLSPSRVDLRRAWALELVRAAASEEEGASTAAAAVAEVIDHDTGENLDVAGVEAWAAGQGLCVASVADVARFLGEEGEGEEEEGGRRR